MPTVRLTWHYAGAELSPDESRAICEQLQALGTKHPVLTGVQRGNKLYNCGIDDAYFECEIDLLPYQMHGTGDLFTSVMTAGLVRGYDLRTSVNSAAHFVYDAMEYGRDIEHIFDRGVAFEPLAYKLGSGIYVK